MTDTLPPSLEGQATVVSEAEKVRLVLKYRHPAYPGEDIVTDGSKIEIQAYPGTCFVDFSGFPICIDRSPLGFFLYNEGSAVLSGGLLEGTLSTAWPLLDPGLRGAKLIYNGLKTMNGENLHEIQYQPRERTDMDIRLYFHQDSYRHVLTIAKSAPRVSRPVPYRRNVPGVSGLQAAAPDSVMIYYAVVQTFSEFKTFDGLTLPTTYEIDYEAAVGDRRRLQRYINTFTNVMNNVALDPRNFQMK
ncbi:MAG: hypothetical protein LAO06_03075 [Acidobacteriia bacterium]|nr:hypothetical protein [Terriglobia bacterium]